MADCPGTYHLAETGDGALARLRVPGGELSADRLRIVAALAEEQGNGQIDLTNRGNLQIRGLRADQGPEIFNSLRSAGLAAPHMIADRYRNITASPASDVDPDAILDVRPDVQALDEALWQVDWLSGLSVKFSFVFDSGGTYTIRDVPHDIGFFAEGVRGRAYYRLSLAGEMSSFCVAPSAAVRFALSFARLVAEDEEGLGRMAPLLVREGEDRLIRSACEIAQDDVSRRSSGEALHRMPAITLPGPHAQNGLNKITYGLGVPLQRLTPSMCRALSTLCEVFGDGTVRMAPGFMIFIANIEPENIEEVRSLADAHGFLTDAAQGMIRVVACAGSGGCHRAELDTKEDGAAIMRALDSVDIPLDEPVTIHLSGCDRGCAFASQADLLLLARSDAKGYTAYRNARTKEAGILEPGASCLKSTEIGPYALNLLRQG